MPDRRWGAPFGDRGAYETVSRSALACGEIFFMGTGEERSASISQRTSGERGTRTTDGARKTEAESSPSVSVSVSSPAARARRLAGFALRLKVRTVASSSVGKRTFLGVCSSTGVAGAEQARRWSGGRAMWGAEEEDLREDLRGLPLESRTGVDAVRTVMGRRGGECGGEAEEEGKGMGSLRSESSGSSSSLPARMNILGEDDIRNSPCNLQCSVLSRGHIRSEIRR